MVICLFLARGFFMVVLRGKEGSVSAHQHSETLPRSLAVIYTGKHIFCSRVWGGLLRFVREGQFCRHCHGQLHALSREGFFHTLHLLMTVGNPSPYTAAISVPTLDHAHSPLCAVTLLFFTPFPLFKFRCSATSIYVLKVE